MIERIYLKNHLSFDEVELVFGEVELNLSKGLMIFTGPSGAGKSVLIQGILSIFAYFDVSASLAEALVNADIFLDDYGIEADDELIFKVIKKEKARYFINNQAVSKKIAKKIADNFIDYLSLRNAEEFSKENLLKIVDKFSDVRLDEFGLKFEKYKKLKKELEEIEKKEQKSQELKEFLEYEISKIEAINPKNGEFEELMKIKKSLSKIEKIKKLSLEIGLIFDYESKVNEFLQLVDVDGSFFVEAMNELRGHIEESGDMINHLEEVDIEEVLDRLEQLQGLLKRFGSVDECLSYLNDKKNELLLLENIVFEKKNLKDEIVKLEKELDYMADIISQKRKNGIKIFEENLNYFLQKLYMPDAVLYLKNVSLNEWGKDEVVIQINQTDINSISTGEFNRLRLALLASKIEFEDSEKALFLDEIDANLSGEESMSVAEVLEFLAKKYQIFAISHQPQLTSKANKHFFVGKKDGKSFVRELNFDERIQEIARIISGKELKKEAIEYAKQLLKDK